MVRLLFDPTTTGLLDTWLPPPAWVSDTEKSCGELWLSRSILAPLELTTAPAPELVAAAVVMLLMLRLIALAPARCCCLLLVVMSCKLL